MNQKEKLEYIEEALINKMMEKHNLTLEDIKSNLDEDKRWVIDGQDWFVYYTMTKEEYEVFRKWAINEIKKTFRMTKRRAEDEFGWWFLNIGLRVADENGKTEFVNIINKKD